MADALDFAVDLDTIKDRLKLLNYFVSVDEIDGAQQMISDGMGRVPPCAFVSVASETAEANKLIGGNSIRQRVYVRISILFAIQAARFDKKAKASVERTRLAVIRQLIGFTPGRANRYMEYERYLLRAQGNGLIWGECLFTTGYFIGGAVELVTEDGTTFDIGDGGHLLAE